MVMLKMFIPLVIDKIKSPHPCLAALAIKYKIGALNANTKNVNPVISAGRPTTFPKIVTHHTIK